MTQIHNFLNTFKIMIKNDEFNYTDSYLYKNTLLKIFDDIIYCYNLNKTEKYNDEFAKNYTYNEKLILNIVGNLFESKNGYENFDLNNTNDIEYIENYFNQISLNIDGKNNVINQNLILPVAAPTSNNIDINHKKLIIANDRRIDNYAILEQQRRRLESEERFLYQNNIDRKDKIIDNHTTTMNMLINKDLVIWKDSNNKLYYRPKAFEEKQKVTKSDICDIIKDILGFYVNIYDNVESVTVIDANYLIISLLPIVKKEIFNPFSANEFTFITNNMYYKNTFEYTELLKKRFFLDYVNQLENSIKNLELRSTYYNNLYNEINEKKEELRTINNSLHVKDYSFIFNFLKLIFQNENEFYYFFNWLTNFFQNLRKSNIVTVLIGDSETTDFLINSIIKPIFIKKKRYITVITNDILKDEKDFDKLLENKVFYHINNLNDKTDIKQVDKIIKEIIKPNYSTHDEAWDNDESSIYGELLVTSSKDSPYLYLKNVLSCCTILRIKDMETVLNTLNIDYSAFERNIFSDLDNFTNILLQNSKNYNYLEVLETDEKTYLKTMKKGVLVTPKIDQKIDSFIKDILWKNSSKFNSIKNYDEDIYEELIYNFKENKIAQPMLNKYFNMIYDEMLIPDNNEFIKILQNKVKMFNDTPSDDSKYNGKKRYEIYQ